MQGGLQVAEAVAPRAEMGLGWIPEEVGSFPAGICPGFFYALDDGLL